MAIAAKRYQARTNDNEIIPPRVRKAKSMEQDDAVVNQAPKSCLRHKSDHEVKYEHNSPPQSQGRPDSQTSMRTPQKSALKQRDSCSSTPKSCNTKTDQVELIPATDQAELDGAVATETGVEAIIDMQTALISLQESSKKSRDLLTSIYDGTYVSANGQKKKLTPMKNPDAIADERSTQLLPNAEQLSTGNLVTEARDTIGTLETTTPSPAAIESPAKLPSPTPQKPQKAAIMEQTKTAIKDVASTAVSVPEVSDDNAMKLPSTREQVAKKSALKSTTGTTLVANTTQVDSSVVNKPALKNKSVSHESVSKSHSADQTTTKSALKGSPTLDTSNGSGPKYISNESALKLPSTDQTTTKSALKSTTNESALKYTSNESASKSNSIDQTTKKSALKSKANASTDTKMESQSSDQTIQKPALKSTSSKDRSLAPESATEVVSPSNPPLKKSAMKKSEQVSTKPIAKENETTQLPQSPTNQMSKSLVSELSELADSGNADDVHPLKEIMTAKKGKIDAERLRSALESMTKEDTKRWLDAPLDSMLPSALFYAIGATLSDIVSLLIDFGVDPQKKYEGKKMYQGWIKCDNTPAEAVMNRKRRFVGTMLGDRLEEIWNLLKHAESQKPEMEAGNVNAHGEKRLSATEMLTQTKSSKNSSKRKTIKLTSIWGTIEHTQGDPSDKYDMGTVLEGVFTPIRMAVHKSTGEKRAIKAEMKVDEELVWEEVTILRKVHHPNVIRLYETYEDDKQIFVVLDLCCGGEMFKRLFREGGIAAGSASRLMHQCALSIEYIHSVNICHRDIQPENFLLKDSGSLFDAQIKLIDFSRAKEFGPDQEMKTKICNVFFVAPEVLSRKDVPYTEKVDIWSLGVVFFLMFCGVQPFNGETELATLKKVKRGAFTFSPEDVWADVNDEAKNLIQAMLVVKPESRLSASSVVKHPWVNPAIKKRLSQEQATLVSAAQLCSLRNFSARDRLNKVVVSMQQQELPRDGMKALASAFRKLDKQNSGRVHVSQVRDKIRRIAALVEYQEEIMRVLWNLGSDGIVSFDMFVNGMIERHRTLQKETCKAIFDVVDYNGVGTISPECLDNAIQHDDGNLRSSSSTLKIGLELVFGLPVDDVKNLLSERQPCRLSDFYDLMNRQSNFETILTT